MPEWLPLAAIVLACPVGMGLMMFFMMKGMRGEHGSMSFPKSTESPQERLARLEAEKRALERQIADAGSPQERLSRLEAEKRTLEQQIAAPKGGEKAGMGF